MTDKKIITRISNEIGNQLFMYASSFAIAKKLNRKLFLDNETSFTSKKNISNYGLNNFKITSSIADQKDKFLGIEGYLRRKILKKIDFFLKQKNFYIERKDNQKKTEYDKNLTNSKFADKVFFEGYFESEKYFIDFKDEILNEFDFTDIEKYKKSPFFSEISQKNTVSICIRQNRFVEGRGTYSGKNLIKSNKFRDEQIDYINRSIFYMKKHLDNPIFYLWSNDLDNIDMSSLDTNLTKISHNTQNLKNIDQRALDLFLISQCNHHIVIPSSFNWWGAWLCRKNDKIICRPHKNFFTYFSLNNKDFWPEQWVEIS